MNHQTNRRDFISLIVGASLARPLSQVTGFRPSPASSENPSEPKRFLQPFDYDGVRLLDGALRDQYLATRDFYFNIPDDDILKGFRKRAGLPAPGNEMGGW